MLFSKNVDPDLLPFAIQEKPLLAERARKKVDDILSELKTIKEHIARLEKEWMEKGDRFNSQIEEIKKGIADVSKPSPQRGKKEDTKDDELIRNLLHIMDGLEECLQSSSQGGEDKMEGDILNKTKRIHLKLNTLFRELGVSKVPSIGNAFDPKFHIPVGINKDKKHPDSTITEEKLAGYTQNGKVIRHGEVIVAKGD